MELQESLPLLHKRGLGLAAISYDSPAILKNFSARKGITFPLLSDDGSKIIRAFGILNESVPPSSPFAGVPHPVTYIVDRDGRVLSRHFEDDYRKRYTVANILAQKFGERPREARSETAAKHLALTASASNGQVRGGERIRLFLEIDLPRNMHVYAPGVQGYISIDWSMADSPGWTSLPVDYPPASRIHLRAINETVPAYKGRFSLQREIVIADGNALKPAIQDGRIALAGTLRYQACDDRQCFTPETVPLRWTLRFEPHDRERAPAELRRVPGR